MEISKSFLSFPPDLAGLQVPFCHFSMNSQLWIAVWVGVCSTVSASSSILADCVPCGCNL